MGLERTVDIIKQERRREEPWTRSRVSHAARRHGPEEAEWFTVRWPRHDHRPVPRERSASVAPPAPRPLAPVALVLPTFFGPMTMTVPDLASADGLTA